MRLSTDTVEKGRRSQYQKLVYRLWHLILGPGYGNYVARHFRTRKVNFAIPFLFKVLDFAHASNEFSMVQAVDDDRLRDEFCVLQNRTSQMGYKLSWKRAKDSASKLSGSHTTFSTMSMISCLTKSRL